VDTAAAADRYAARRAGRPIRRLAHVVVRQLSPRGNTIKVLLPNPLPTRGRNDFGDRLIEGETPALAGILKARSRTRTDDPFLTMEVLYRTELSGRDSLTLAAVSPGFGVGPINFRRIRFSGVKLIRTQPRDIRIGDLVGGRKVRALERTSYGVLVQRVGKVTRELFTDDSLVDVMRPDCVAMQALVQANASL
jgi:hypothetical protein